MKADNKIEYVFIKSSKIPEAAAAAAAVVRILFQVFSLLFKKALLVLHQKTTTIKKNIQNVNDVMSCW